MSREHRRPSKEPEVVILHGEIEIAEPEESVADAYEVKYHHRPQVPWLEADYPRTATRFDFDA